MSSNRSATPRSRAGLGRARRRNGTIARPLEGRGWSWRALALAPILGLLAALPGAPAFASGVQPHVERGPRMVLGVPEPSRAQGQEMETEGTGDTGPELESAPDAGTAAADSDETRSGGAQAEIPPSKLDTAEAFSWDAPITPDGLDLTGGPDATGYRFCDLDLSNVDAEGIPLPGDCAGIIPNLSIAKFIDIRATGTALGLSDDGSAQRRLNGEPLVSPDPDVLPFFFTFYDTDHELIYVNANGNLSFGAPHSTFNNSCPLPSGGPDVIAGLWDDLFPPTGGEVYVRTIGNFPNRIFIAQWEAVSHIAEQASTYTFQIQLFERTDNILMVYKDVEAGGPDGLAISPFDELAVGSVPGDKVQRFALPSGFFLNNAAQHNAGGLDAPAGLAYGPDRTGDGVEDLYVASFETDQIIVFNGDDGTLLGPLVAEGAGGLDGPRGLAFDASNNLLVASFNTDQVLKFDSSTGLPIGGAFIGSGNGLDGPDSLLIGPDGQLYVSSFNSDRVLRYNAATGAFVDTFVAAGAGGLDGPRGLAFAPFDGNLYVASQNTDQVLRYGSGFGAFFDVVVDASDGIDQPRGLLFGPDAGGDGDLDLYVASFATNQVRVFSVDMSFFSPINLPLTPNAMVIGPGSDLYVATAGTDAVQRYDGSTGLFEGNHVAPGSGGLNDPFDLLFHTDGLLYVTSSASDQVLRYNAASGAFVSAFVTDDPLTLLTDEDGGLDEPRGLAFGPDGSLYVASSTTNEIKRYHGTTGAYLGNFVTAGSGGLSQPTDIAFFGGELLVSSTGSDEIKRYNQGTGAFLGNRVSAGLAGLNGPTAMNFDLPGLLLVAGQLSQDVLAYDSASGAFEGRFVPAGSGFLSQPFGLAVSPAGRLLASSRFPGLHAILATDATLRLTIDAGGDFDEGRSATVGIQKAAGADSLTYLCGSGSTTVASPPVVSEDLAIFWKAPLPPGADLEVVYKIVDDNMPNEGDTITYEIKVQNNGRDDATGVEIFDELPEGVTYVSSVASQGSYNPGTHIWSGFDLDVFEMATLQITVSVDPDTASTLGRFLEEYVVQDGDPPDTPEGRLIKPTGMAMFGGDLYVASSGRNEILRYDAAGNFIEIFVGDDASTPLVDESGGLLVPEDILFNGGFLYVSSYGTDQVLRYDAGTGAFDSVFVEEPTKVFPDGLAGPQGLVFDGSELLVASGRNSQVRRYNAAGGFMEVVAANTLDPLVPFPGSSLSDPFGLLIGPDRNDDSLDDLYVTSRNTGEILVFDLATQQFIEIFANGLENGLSGPTNMAFGPNGGLFVVSMGSGEVFRFDEQTGEFGHKFVREGRGGLTLPIDLVFTPSGTLKVTSKGTHQVLEYGARASGDPLGVVDSGSHLDELLAITGDDTGILYAAARKNGDADNLVVWRYNAESGELAGDMPFIDEDIVGPLCIFGTIDEVNGIAISPDNKRLFVSVEMSCGQSAVLRFRGPQDNELPGEFLGIAGLAGSGLFGPDRFKGMVFGPDGNLYVARYAAFAGFNRIQRFDGDTGADLGTFASGGGMEGPWGLDFGRDQNDDGIEDLYVGDFDTNQVLLYSGATGGFLGVFVTPGSGGLSGPTGLRIGKDGELYVSSFNNDRVLRYSGYTGAFIDIFATSGMDGPGNLFFAPAGDLFLASRNNDRILRFDGAAAFLGVCAAVTDDGLICGTYLTFGPDGNLYVSSYHSDDVKRYQGPDGADPGAFIDIFVDASDGLDGPQDIEFGPDGNFYVVSQNNDAVLRFTPAGAPLPAPLFGGANFILAGGFGLDIPTGLTFHPQTDDLLVSSTGTSQIYQFLGPNGGIFAGLPFGFPFDIDPFVDFGGVPALVAPQDITYGPDGNLFVSVPNGVYRYDGDFGTWIDLFAGGGGLAGPRGLTFGPDQNLYVTSKSKDVFVYAGPLAANAGDLIGGFVQEDPPDDGNLLKDPVDAEFGPDGSLFVSSCDESQVLRYSGFISNFATISGDQPDSRLVNNTKSVGIVVKGADLAVEKTVSDATPIVGDEITFTVTVTNQGPESAPDVVATDIIPSLLGPGNPFTLVSTSASQGSYDSGTGIWTVGALAYDPLTETGESATLQITVEVNVGAPQLYPVVTNTVEVEDGVQGDPDDRNNMASVDVFLIYADLELTKTVDNNNPSEGDIVEFTLTVTHLGEDPVSDIVVVDRLPAGLQYISSTPNPGGTYDRPTGLWTLNTTLDIDPGTPAIPDSVSLTIQALVLPGTGGTTIVNEGRIGQASLNDPDLDNNEASASLNVRGANLSIEKSVTPGPYIEGSQHTFTLTVENAPGGEIAVNTRVIDKLPPGLGFVSALASIGTYDAATGLWIIGDLAPGAPAVTLEIVVEILPGYGGQDIVNTASVTSDTGDEDRSNNSDSVTLTPPNVDLVVSKSPQPNPAVAGEPLIYTITVRNQGRTVAPNAVLTDVLPAGVTYVADDNLPPCVEGPPGTLVCQLGDIPGGGEKIVQIQTEVHPLAFVDRLALGEELVLSNHVEVSHDEFELDPTNDAIDQLTILVDRADLKVLTLAQASAPPLDLAALDGEGLRQTLEAEAAGESPLSPNAEVRAGEIFGYTILVENLGPSAARRVQVTDNILSSGNFSVESILDDPNRSSDSCSLAPAPAPQSGQLIVCQLADPLEPVESGLGSGRWTIQVELRALQTQDVNHEVRVVSRDDPANRLLGTPDPILENNVSRDAISVLDTSNLRLTKTASGQVHDPATCGLVTSQTDRVTAGDRLVYTLQVFNDAPGPGEPGGSTATEVVVRDFLPAGLEVISISGTGPAGPAGCSPGTPGLPSDPAECQVGSLATGQSATLRIEVLVDHDYILQSESRFIQNGALTFSENIDPDLSNNLAGNSTEVAELADLQLGKSSTPDPVIAGTPLGYELRVWNDGPSTARQVVVRDQLPAGLRFVSARIENQRSGEACSYAAGTREVVCSLRDVPPSEADTGRLIFIESQVDASLDPQSLTNTASASSDQTPDCNPANSQGIEETTAVETQADLEVVKTSDPDKVYAGEQKRYEIWVDNRGPSDARDVVVYDLLPDEVIYEIDTSSPMCTRPANLVGLRALLSGASEVPPAASNAGGLASFILNTDTGRLTYAVELADIDNLQGAAGIHIHTGAAGVNGPIEVFLYDGSAPAPAPTEPLQGEVTLTPGQVAAITGNPAGFYVNVHTTDFPGGEIRGQLAQTTGAPLRCPIGYLPAGQAAHLDIWTEVRPEILAGTTITNVAMVTSQSSLGDPDSTNDVDSAKNLVLGKSDLKVTKFGKNDGQVRAGEVLTYTIIVDNLGPSWAEGVAIKDVFQTSGVFDLVDIATDRPAVCRTLPARPDQPAGGIPLPASAWPVTDPPPAFGVLDPTGIEDIDQRLEMDCELTEVIQDAPVDTAQLAVLEASGPPNPGRWILTVRLRAANAQDVNNIADVLTSHLDPDPDNDHAEVSHEITDVSDLVVDKQATGEVQVDGQPGDIYDPGAPAAFPQAPGYSTSAVAATAGRRIRYQIDIRNDGPSHAENVWLRDRLPAGVTLLPGTLVVTAGGVTLPAGSCQTGTPGDAGDPLRCGLGTLLGVGSPGNSASVSFDVLVDSALPAGTILENDVRVGSDVFDPNSANDQDYVHTRVEQAADIALSKTAIGQNVTGYDTTNQQFLTEDLANSVTAGLLLRYTIQAQNEGPSDTPQVLLRDQLPDGLSLEGVEGASCRADAVNDNILYCSLGAMAAGERRSFDLLLRVDPALPEGTVLENCVSGLDAISTPPGQPPALPGLPPGLPLAPDPFDPNSTGICQQTTVNAVADVGGPGSELGPGSADYLRKRDIPAAQRLDSALEPDLALAGREHRYLIEFGNAGPSTALDVTIVDRLDFKQVGIPGETFLRCEPADPDDLVECVYDAASHTVRLERLLDHNEPIFQGGLGTLQPGLPYRFYLITRVDPGYVLDADNGIATAENSEPGLIARNTARIDSSTTDFRTANDVDTERTRIIAEADLSIEKTDIFGDPIENPDNYFLFCDPVVPGGMITYDLTVENAGPSDAAEVFVVDWLPPGLVVLDPEQVMVEVSAGEVVEVRDDGRLTIRLGNDPNNAGAAELGRLNEGSSATIRIQVMVRLDATCGGLAVNEAYVETRRNDAMWPPALTGPDTGDPKGPPTSPRTPTLDPVSDNNRDTETTRIECPSIRVRKTVSFNGQCPGRDITLINEPGQPVTFCYEITNTGTTYLDTIMVTDTLQSLRMMPMPIFTDTITHGADPKLPVAPGETVLRQTTVPQLTRECGNVTDTVEVSANPVNAGRTDLPCLPIVTDSDTRNIEVPCSGVDFRLQLPVVATDECEGWLQVQNVGDRDTIALLVFWGEPGFCPPQAAGPLKAECSGLLRPGSAWSFLDSQLPFGARSAVAYSLSSEIVEPQPGQEIPFGLLVCDEVFRIAGSHGDWLAFDQAYQQRGTWRDFDFGEYQGEPLAISVNRNCPDPVNPGARVNAAYIGISSDMEGAYDPKFGGYTYYAPMVFAGRGGLETAFYIQNSGVLCTSLEIWFKGQDACLRPILGDVLSLAPGESIRFEASSIVGPDWLGSAWIRGTQPLGIVVDTMGANHFTSYAAVPGDVADLNFSLGDQINYAPLVYSEHQGWDSLLQVQNLSATLPAKVKVYFYDRSGDVKTTLVDWICPRGSQTFFSPVLAGLPGNWVGHARVESQDWWTNGTNPQDAPRIQSVVLLEKWSDPARTTRRESVAYNAHTETVYNWQVGSRKGGLTDGSAVFAVPLLAKGNRGISSEIAITNLVPKPGFTDFAIFLYDQNGLLDFVCQKLHDRQTEYIDLSTWGIVPPNFLGSMVVSAVFWEHEVFDGEGQFQRNLVGLSAVAVERVGATSGSEDLPGDESKAFEAFPLFDFFLQEQRPNCPGVPGP